VGHSVGLVLNATRQWFIRFCATPNNLGVPVSSWGTLEYNRVGLTVYCYVVSMLDIKILFLVKVVKLIRHKAHKFKIFLLEHKTLTNCSMGRGPPEGLEPLLHAEGCYPRPMQKYYYMSYFTGIKGVAVGIGEVRVNTRGGTPNTHPATQAAKILQRGYHFCFIF
jgi:hypothetical protein